MSKDNAVDLGSTVKGTNPLFSKSCSIKIAKSALDLSSRYED